MKKFLKVIIYLIVLSAIGLISGHLTFELLSYGRTIEMPELIGKDLNEAQKLLTLSKLHIRLDGDEHDNYIPQGHILRQDIPAGNKLKEGREIGVILSKGPRIKDVPNIVGKPLDVADIILKEKGLKINKIIYVHSEFADKNVILAQRPEPQESGGDLFRVIVSLGKFPEEERND